MIPTAANVFDLARKKLGDSEVAGGQIFTNTYLQDHLQSAYSDLFNVLSENGTRLVYRNAHFVLPAHSEFFLPASAGIANFGRPLELRTNKIRLQTTVSAGSQQSSPDRYRVTTGAAHGLASGDHCIVYKMGGLSDEINNQWSVVLVDATNVDLMGVVPTGTYTSGGIFVVSENPGSWTEEFSLVDDPHIGESQVGVRGAVFSWDGVAVRLRGVDYDRLLRIAYMPSATAPSSGSLFFDNSLNFLAYRAAALAAEDKGASTAAQSLNYQALGERMLADSRAGGFLGQLVALSLKTYARKVTRTKRFRPKRNTGLTELY